MSSQKDFTVAIVGGGIVGLITAIGLARGGIDVDVFEAAVSESGDGHSPLGERALTKAVHMAKPGEYLSSTLGVVKPAVATGQVYL